MKFHSIVHCIAVFSGWYQHCSVLQVGMNIAVFSGWYQHFLPGPGFQQPEEGSKPGSQETGETHHQASSSTFYNYMILYMIKPLHLQYMITTLLHAV